MPKEWADELNRMSDKDEQTEGQEIENILQNLQSKVANVNSKLERLFEMYLNQDIEREKYLKQKNELTLEKKSLTEQVTRLKRNTNVWLEPLKEWLKQAQTIEEIVNAPTLERKKSAARSIAGSNLLLHNQKIEITPQPQWAALRAAHAEISKSNLSLVLVRLYEVARTYFLTQDGSQASGSN